MIRHAIFIEPVGQLREHIEYWKDKIERAMPGMPYGSHPPHVTLFVAPLLENGHQIDVLREKLDKVSPFVIDVGEPLVFYDDALAGGGHTLVLRIGANPQLSALQCEVAEGLSVLVDRRRLGPLSEGLDVEPFRESQRRYGFPFVGEHWIPHFSIASVKADRDHLLIDEFIASKKSFHTLVEKLGIWSVEGDGHSRLAEIDCKGNA